MALHTKNTNGITETIVFASLATFKPSFHTFAVNLFLFFLRVFASSRLIFFFFLGGFDSRNARA
jgi:hypothetical protein